MLKIQFILTLRYLLKNKVYTLINIISLSVAIGCSLIIYLYINEELNYDNHHIEGDNVYRVYTQSLDNEIMSRASTFPLYDVLKKDISQIQHVSSVYHWQGILIWIEEDGKRKKFEEEQFCVFVEPEYFEILKVDWLIEDETPLQDPGEVVLSESYATKFFGGAQKAIGQSIIFDKQYEYIVSGVVKDYEELTDFSFQIMGSYAGIKDDVSDDDWNSYTTNVQFLVRLYPEADTSAVHQQLLEVAKKNNEDWEYNKSTFALQPLSDIHHNQQLSNFSSRIVPVKSLYIFASIAFFLILVASINYINLATALAANRSKEVGIKKAIGSSRRHIIFQFLSETAIIIIISVAFAILIAEVFIHLFATKFNLSLDTFSLLDVHVFLFLIGLTLTLIFLSGLYPAIVISATSVVEMFRFKSKKGSISFFRKSMVLFQFLIAQLMILSTIVLFQQNALFKNKELGFSAKNILNVYLPPTTKEQRQMIQHEWLQITGVEKLSFAYSSPTSGNVWINNVGLPEMESFEYVNADIKLVDENYLDVYELKLLAGRNVQNADSMNAVIINELLANKLGFADSKEAVGKLLKLFEREVPIVGVVENFHTRSLKTNLVPTLLVNRSDNLNLVNLKINSNNFDGGVEKINAHFDQLFPDDIFNYDYLEENLAEYYAREVTTSKIFNIFAIIALIINLSGLYGLISFVALQKTKEVGIRKVLGAKSIQIVTMLSKDFMVLVILAFLFAAPIGYYLMQQWLNEFVHKIEISVLFFLIALGTSAILAMLVVGLQAYKTSTTNPADVLRDE